jgi:hypothetical protein
MRRSKPGNMMKQCNPNKSYMAWVLMKSIAMWEEQKVMERHDRKEEQK